MSEIESQQTNRRGDLSKCPACGSRVDADAYRCPNCLIYYCFRCRRRIQEGELQYACASRSCGAYGKLLCAACTTTITEERPATSVKENRLAPAIIGGAAVPLFTLALLSWLGLPRKWPLIAALAAAGAAVGAMNPWKRSVPGTVSSSRLACTDCRGPVEQQGRYRQRA